MGKLGPKYGMAAMIRFLATRDNNRAMPGLPSSPLWLQILNFISSVIVLAPTQLFNYFGPGLMALA